MRFFLVTYFINFLLEAARELSRKSSSEIDDEIVGILEDNRGELVSLIMDKM